MVWQKTLSCSEGQMEKVTKRVASMLLSGEAKSVVVLTGAGVSTGAGQFCARTHIHAIN